jgi:hypothetical protein
MIRGARLDRNPLRRATDKIQTCLLAALFVALAVAGPFLVGTASRASYVSALQARQQQEASRHLVPAVLSADVPAAGGFAPGGGVMTAATWKSATGVRRSGPVPALADGRKGQVVQVWTDDSTGNLDAPPLTLAEAAGQADAAMVGAIAGIIVAYTVGAGVVVGLLNRRRMAAWEADWLVTAPAWNRQQRW